MLSLVLNWKTICIYTTHRSSTLWAAANWYYLDQLEYFLSCHRRARNRTMTASSLILFWQRACARFSRNCSRAGSPNCHPRLVLTRNTAASNNTIFTWLTKARCLDLGLNINLLLWKYQSKQETKPIKFTSSPRCVARHLGVSRRILTWLLSLLTAIRLSLELTLAAIETFQNSCSESEAYHVASHSYLHSHSIQLYFQN